jgi:ABC-type glycerol-3-phosphate transport system permease component
LFLARQFILGIPRDLIEAARIDGAGHVRVFTRIVLPLSMVGLFLIFQRYVVQGFTRSGIR